jgi:LysM repeat protein
MFDEYGIFFDMENITIRLPVNPQEFSIKTKSNNKTYELVNIGEINIIKDIPLRDLSFKGILPESSNYPWVVTKNQFEYPSFYLTKFREYRESKKPVRFIITRKSNNNVQTNMLVTIEDFTETETAGTLGQWEYSISLKEYREYGSRKMNIQQPSSSSSVAKIVSTQPERPTTKVPPKEYEVKSGDTLWAIAKRELNNGSRYPEIASLNNIANANIISVGQKLILPDLA